MPSGGFDQEREERDEQELPAVYDFLYRDRPRIESYYAQIFGGRTLSLEKTESVNKRREWRVKATLPTLISGERHSPEEHGQTSKQVIDPHDAATIDVLQWLSENGYITDSVGQAEKNGHLVSLNGSLMLSDRILFVGAAKALSGNPQGTSEEELSSFKLGVELFANYPMPSMFTLKADNNLYAGTLRDEDMEHQMSSHTWKFGSNRMRDVHVIGIVETPDEEPSTPESLVSMSSIANTLHDWFPSSAVRLTPLVMYRRLISTKNRSLWQQ